jgi:hypothetical protein
MIEKLKEASTHNCQLQSHNIGRKVENGAENQTIY